MEDKISPNYQMKLVNKIEEKLWKLFDKNKYKNVEFYIEKWHEYYYDLGQNFNIFKKEGSNIDLPKTLHGIDGDLLIKIAIDLGIETPDFIPAIPVFRNDLKKLYKNTAEMFESAFKEVENDPSLAVQLANSTLESIIKNIIKNYKNEINYKDGDTLYKLTEKVLKFFKLYPSDKNIDKEIIKIGSSFLVINQTIEKLRSKKTKSHGKTEECYLINDSIYSYFIVNSVATIGLFLKTYYEKKFSKLEAKQDIKDISTKEIPF